MQSRVKKVFSDYTKNYNPKDPKIALKIAHTYRVAELCREIAESLNLSDNDIQLAWLIGMLHDIGRFEQIRIYHTFLDRESVDHAEFGADLLFKNERLITEYISDRSFDDIIEVAIRQHNKFRISPDLNDRTLMFCNILRDADKIDIFRVNVEEPIEGIYDVSLDELKKESISKDAMAQVLEHHAITRDACHTNMDHYLGHLAMAFELVYSVSKRIAIEQGYLMKLFEFESENIGTQKAITLTKEELLETFFYHG